MHSNESTFSNSNLYFSTVYPLLHISTNFISNFLQQIFSSRHAHFSTLIKCKKSCIFIVEYFPSSEDITIFDKILQQTTQFDKIRFVYWIHPGFMSQNVSWCQIMKLNVELSEPTFPFHTNIIPLNQKSKQKLFDKFIQNPHDLL